MTAPSAGSRARPDHPPPRSWSRTWLITGAVFLLAGVAIRLLPLDKGGQGQPPVSLLARAL